MRAYVGVTDQEWYDFLASRPDVDEVNFWRPGGAREFRVLTPGEPFFFKTHYPHNRVVGGGLYSGFAQLRVSEAWEFFDQANGAVDLDQMRRRVGRYRRQALGPQDDPEIGCVFVREVRFLPRDGAADAPPEFAPNIVQGKSYDLGNPSVSGYFGELLGRLHGDSAEVNLAPWKRDGHVFGESRPVRPRLGQRAFQAVLLRAYDRRCAITGDKIRPVLQAAHIRPVAAGGEHRIDNGLLLRSDVHILFDQGYLGVDPRHRLLVSPRLRDEFGNGDEFYARAGQQISVPVRTVERLYHEFVEWHLDTLFKAS